MATALLYEQGQRAEVLGLSTGTWDGVVIRLELGEMLGEYDGIQAGAVMACHRIRTGAAVAAQAFRTCVSRGRQRP